VALHSCVQLASQVKISERGNLDIAMVGLTGRLAPNLDIGIRNRFAGLDIDNLHVQDHWDADLAIRHVGTDELSANIYHTKVNPANPGYKPKHCHHLQYGPSVTSGLSTQELLLAKTVDGGASGEICSSDS
jgi:hypothetical protein